MKSKKNLVLVGMMGSGKSTIGYLISKELNLKFIDMPNSFSISESISIKFNSNFFAISEPIDDFPDPIIPKKTRFSFDFISFFIEKTQICLNLKLSKFICNLLKKQVREQAL